MSGSGLSREYEPVERQVLVDLGLVAGPVRSGPAAAWKVGPSARSGADHQQVGHRPDDPGRSPARSRAAAATPTTTPSCPAYRCSSTTQAVSKTASKSCPPACPTAPSRAARPGPISTASRPGVNVWTAGRGTGRSAVRAAAPGRGSCHLQNNSSPSVTSGGRSRCHWARSRVPHHRFRERGARSFLGPGGDALGQLAGQHLERSAVGHRVVNGHGQHGLLRADPEQGRPHRRLGAER